MYTFEEYLAVAKTTTKHPSLRKGQAYYNALHSMHPVLARQICGGDLDPYHDDNLIPAFLSYVEAHWFTS
jgi:hypothetical protein